MFLRLQIIIYVTFFNLKLKFTEQIIQWMNPSCFQKDLQYICVHFQVVGINLASAKLVNLKCIKHSRSSGESNLMNVVLYSQFHASSIFICFLYPTFSD